MKTPIEDLEELIRKMDYRQCRLFCCDCIERMLGILEARHSVEPCVQEAIDTARRFANGNASHDELGDINRKVFAEIEDIQFDGSYSDSDVLTCAFFVTQYFDPRIVQERCLPLGVLITPIPAMDYVKDIITRVREARRYHAKSNQEAKQAVEAELTWQKQRALWYLQNRDASASDKDIE